MKMNNQIEKQVIFTGKHEDIENVFSSIICFIPVKFRDIERNYTNYPETTMTIYFYFDIDKTKFFNELLKIDWFRKLEVLKIEN